MRKFPLFLASLLAVLFVNQVSIEFREGHLTPQFGLEAADAKRSSGGRSGGGSFSRPSRSSPSRSRSSSPSSSGSSSGSSTRSRTPQPRSTSTPRPRSTSTPQPRSTPTPSSSNSGRTGGRVQGGSFQRTPTPVPTSTPTGVPRSIPTSTPRPVPTRVPQRTAPTYQHNNYELEIEVEQPSRRYYTPVVPNTPNTGDTEPVNRNPDTGVVTPTSDRQTDSNAAVQSQTRRRSSKNSWVKFLFLLLVLGGGVFLVWWLMSRRSQDADGSTPAGVARELDNDIVTVTKLQVALLAEARTVQSELTELSRDADLESREGLTQFLQECALALLRQPEYWTHAQASSETFKSREAAERAFSEQSIAERSKFSAETFSNVGGRVRERDAHLDEDAEPAEYIVVTMLVGTEDDKPLFEGVNSAEDLKQAMQKLAAVTPDYLLVFELLWTPQAETDSLTAEDLLMEYSDIVPL